MKEFDYSSQEIKKLLDLCQQDQEILKVFEGSDYLFNALEKTNYHYEEIVRAFLKPYTPNGIQAFEASFVGYTKHHNDNEDITHLVKLLFHGFLVDASFDVLLPRLNRQPFSDVFEKLIREQNNGWFFDGFLTEFLEVHYQDTQKTRLRKYMSQKDSDHLAKILPFIKDKYFSEQIVEYITSYATLMALDHLLIHEHVRKACYLTLKTARDKNIRELDDRYWKKRTPHFWAMLQKEIIVGELGQLDKGERCTKKM